MPDPDKMAAYDAEDAMRALLTLAAKRENWNYDFYGHKMQLPQERNFADLESIAAYYLKVIQLGAVQDRWPSATAPTVRPRSNGSCAHYDPRKHEVAICIHRGERFALRELVVLHELAHSLERDGHGPRWRGAFLFLVETCMGPEASTVFGAFMYEHVGAPHVKPYARGLQSC